METKITIYAFIAAWIVFILKAIGENADEEGRVHIKTPREWYKDVVKKKDPKDVEEENKDRS